MTKISNQYSLTNILTADLANSRLGINNVSPAYSLDVTGTARTSGATYLATGGANVGIGTTSPAGISTYTTLDIRGATGGGIKIGVTGSSTPFNLQQAGTDAYLNNVASGVMYFLNGDAERMRITSGGLLAIGTTAALINESSLAATSNGNTATFKTTLNGGNALLLWNTATGSQAQVTFFTGTSYTAAGSITTNGTVTSYNVTSDYRLKEDLKEIKGLEKISAIKVYDFKWKKEESRMDGVIAHELQEVLPYAVIGQKDEEKMQQVDYSKIVPVMVKAIQELKIEIDTLKNK